MSAFSKREKQKGFRINWDGNTFHQNLREQLPFAKGQSTFYTLEKEYLFPLEQGFPIFSEESVAMKDQLEYQLVVEHWSPPCNTLMCLVQKVPF